MKSDEEWKKILTPEQYQVCRMKGTERPFTGEYYKTKEPGVYKCVACGNEFVCANVEDGIALADHTLRAEIVARFPRMWRRVIQRREFMTILETPSARKVISTKRSGWCSYSCILGSIEGPDIA